jgi:hypothetical protein
MLHRPEGDLAVVNIDDDRVPGAELLPEDLLRERILDEALERSAQRPCAQAKNKKSTIWQAVNLITIYIITKLKHQNPRTRYNHRSPLHYG